MSSGKRDPRGFDGEVDARPALLGELDAGRPAFVAVEFGAYYSGNNAESAFYTDPTGYNTGKDVGVVYLKKTF